MITWRARPPRLPLLSVAARRLPQQGPRLREQADLAPDKPELLAEQKAARERIASGLLPCPSQYSL
ncbi:hypothetical protein [Streptomyces sp. NPDC101455]|uniref:hypothetical protein n=1 Tax=Streptomyces sp. NPDC101455 TaxID=3366142 RepID=UPI0037F4AA28